MIAFNIDDRRVHWGLELDESEDRSIPLKMTSSQKKKKDQFTRYQYTL